MEKNKKLIIFGTAAIAEVVYWYFKEDSEYEPVAFCANKDRIEYETLLGLPVTPFEEITENYPPSEYEMYIAVGYTKLNKVRIDLYNEAKSKGYKLATYVHSKIKIWGNNVIGDNTFIYEDNTIQPYVKIGDNVVLWSGNHIGHHSQIGSHCFLTSHVVVSGFVNIGEATFIGVNATLRDSINIGKNNVIGAGTLILGNTEDDQVFIGPRSVAIEKHSSDIKKF